MRNVRWDFPPSDSDPNWGSSSSKSSTRRRWLASAILTILGYLVFEPVGNYFWGWLLGRYKIAPDAPIAGAIHWVQQYHIIPLGVAIILFTALLLLFRARGLPRMIDRLFDHLKAAAGWVAHLLVSLWGKITEYVFPATKKVLVALLALAIVAGIAVVIHGQISNRSPSSVYTTDFSSGTNCSLKNKTWSLRTDVGSVQCTSQGMDMTVPTSAPYNSLGELAFHPQAIPGLENLAAYCVGTTATFVAGGADAGILVGVHGQTGWGGQVAILTRAGKLTLEDFDTHGRPANTPLATGTVPAAQTYTLIVGVSGTRINVYVNKQPKAIISVPDSTYTTTENVVIGAQTDNVDEAEALFANFTFHAGTSTGCGS